MKSLEEGRAKTVQALGGHGAIERVEKLLRRRKKRRGETEVIVGLEGKRGVCSSSLMKRGAVSWRRGKKKLHKVGFGRRAWNGCCCSVKEGKKGGVPAVEAGRHD